MFAPPKGSYKPVVLPNNYLFLGIIVGKIVNQHFYLKELCTKFIIHDYEASRQSTMSRTSGIMTHRAEGEVAGPLCVLFSWCLFTGRAFKLMLVNLIVLPPHEAVGPLPLPMLSENDKL